MEQSFRAVTFPETQRHARTLLWITFGSLLLFLVNDFRHLGTALFWPIAGTRLAMLAINLAAIWGIYKATRPVVLEGLIWVTQITLYGAAAAMFHLLPSPLSLSVAAVLVIFNYLIFPVRFRWVAISGVVFTLAFVTAFFTQPGAVPPYFVGILTLMGMANLVGVAVLGRNNRLRRMEFLALEAEQKRRREMEDSELRFRSLAECLPNLVWAFSPEGDCLWVNKAWEEFTGLPATAHLGAGWVGRIHPADREDFLARYATAFKLMRPFQVEHRLQFRDGSHRWVANSGAPWFHGDGSFAGYIGGCVDATDRRLREEEVLRHSAFQDGLGRIQGLALDDLPAEEILRRTLAIVTELPGMMSNQRAALFLADPDRRRLRLIAQHGLGAMAEVCAEVPYGYCLCGRAAESLEIVEVGHMDERHEANLPGMADHGHTCIPVAVGECVVGVLSVTLPAGARLDEPEREFLIAVARNLGGILARRQAEEQLRHERDFSRSLVNSLPGIFYLFDRQNRWLMWNPHLEKVTGYTGAEIAALRPIDLIAEADRALVQTAIDQVFAGGDAHVEARLKTKGGQFVPFDFTGLNREIEGTPCLLGVGFDISEWYAVKEALVRSNADLEDFAYAISHDLQEPLRMVSGYLNLLQRRYQTRLDQEADDFIGFAVDGSGRMQAMIHDLLEYSRINSRGAHRHPVDSRQALRGALDNLVRAIDESGAELEIGELPVVTADAGQLMRLLQNLVGNALKYRVPDRQPVIRISARRQESEWLFSIADNGIGIDAQYFERIFRVFQRLHGRSQYAGTGIGLAVCKRIVERHGGRIWVESKPGEGSTFFFTLPAGGAAG
ncbi:MAG: PAS domain S-box protein [Magnetospirillum sp. WYHS-4]